VTSTVLPKVEQFSILSYKKTPKENRRKNNNNKKNKTEQTNSSKIIMV